MPFVVVGGAVEDCRWGSCFSCLTEGVVGLGGLASVVGRRSREGVGLREGREAGSAFAPSGFSSVNSMSYVIHQYICPVFTV